MKKNNVDSIIHDVCRYEARALGLVSMAQKAQEKVDSAAENIEAKFLI